MPEVAARAGVGKATVYRSLPDQGAPVAAVVIERLADFERRARARLDGPDAWSALRDAARRGRRAPLRRPRDHAPASPTGSTLPEVRAARASLWAALGALMERAKEQGTMRADAAPEDLRMLWAGAARMLVADGVTDAARWRRYAGLVLSRAARPDRRAPARAPAPRRASPASAGP